MFSTKEVNSTTMLIYEITFGILAVIVVTVAILDLSGTIVISQGSLLYSFDYAILIVFAADYFIRLFASKDKLLFFKKNIPDLIAIIPFSSLFKAFRLFRLTRALRFTKLARLTKFSRLFAYSARLYKRFAAFFKTNGLIYVIYFTIGTIMLSSVAISYAEGMNFLDALWWSFVTATTVGYGDISPSSGLGRIIAAILMLVGIGSIGMLTGTVATYFLSPQKQPLQNPGILEKYILDSDELEDNEKHDVINYLRYIKSRRI